MVVVGWPETKDCEEEAGETSVHWGVVMTKPAVGRGGGETEISPGVEARNNEKGGNQKTLTKYCREGIEENFILWRNTCSKNRIAILRAKKSQLVSEVERPVVQAIRTRKALATDVLYMTAQHFCTV